MLQIEVDVAWYRMIALRINLMNISAVTIFLARVVHVMLKPGGSPTIDLRLIYFFFFETALDFRIIMVAHGSAQSFLKVWHVGTVHQEER